METVKTENRALQLAIIDLNPTRKSDEEIAAEWGLDTARSIRNIRSSEAYAAIAEQLRNQVVSYAGEQLQGIASAALDGLADIVPMYINEIRKTLDVSDSEKVSDRKLSTAGKAINVLMRISALAIPETKKTTVEASAIRLPSLVLAESEVETVREYRTRRVTLTVSDDDVIDGDVTVLE